MAAPRTCVITINYRNAADTARCVASLQLSTVAVDVVVVDNTPHDPSLASALAEFPRTSILRPECNLGFGNGNNLGVEHALQRSNYDFLFFLNNDAAIEIDAIEQLQACADRHPEAGIFGPRITLMQRPDVLWYGGGYINWYRGGAVAPGILGIAESPLAMTSRLVDYVTGCAMFVRTDVMRKLGGFDPRFFMYEEDVELCLRASAAHSEIWYESSALVRHKGQGSLAQTGARFTGLLSPDNANAAFYGYHVARNKIINVKLHAHGWNRLRGMLGVTSFLARKLVLLGLHRRFAAVASIVRGTREGIFS